MHYTASIVIEKNEDGYFAWCPPLQGCHTQGDTLEETLEHAKEAVAVYLEALTPEERAELGEAQVSYTQLEVDV